MLLGQHICLEQIRSDEYVGHVGAGTIRGLQGEVSREVCELFTRDSRWERKERFEREERGGGVTDGGYFTPCVLFDKHTVKELNWKAYYGF